MDQSFSVGNLRIIWDMHTRKGDKLLNFYPDVAEAFERRRNARRDYREMRAGRLNYVGPAELEPSVLLDRLTKEANNSLTNALRTTSERLMKTVAAGTFQWGLHSPGVHNGRTVFALGAGADTFFADRQLQRTIAALTHRHPTSRQSIVAGLSRTLDSHLPKLIIKTDIERFYESISHEKIRAKLNAEDLSPTFRGLVYALLDETAQLTGVECGLPTGVGLSAKLADYFLADLDEVLRTCHRVLYYARYVDDIIIIYGQREPQELERHKIHEELEKLVNCHSLKLSTEKTTELETDESGNVSSFDFLGYQFSYGPTLETTLTQKRQAELKRRIDRTFEAWAKSDAGDHGSRRLLLDRLRYLAGNFRLINNKRNAMIGIYFSNPHLTSNASVLADLDAHLATRLSEASLPNEVKDRLKNITFSRGFTDRTVYKFTPNQLRRVRGAWFV